MNRSPLTIAAVLWSFLLFAGPAFAADPRLDQAYDTLIKAQALVNAAEDPGAKRRQFNGHAAKAADLIGKALKEIQLAKVAADRNP